MINGCFPRRKFHVSGNSHAQLRQQRMDVRVSTNEHFHKQQQCSRLSYSTCMILGKLLSRLRTAAKARGRQYEAGKLVRAGEPGLASTITKSQLWQVCAPIFLLTTILMLSFSFDPKNVSLIHQMFPIYSWPSHFLEIQEHVPFLKQKTLRTYNSNHKVYP